MDACPLLSSSSRGHTAFVAPETQSSELDDLDNADGSLHEDFKKLMMFSLRCKTPRNWLRCFVVDLN